MIFFGFLLLLIAGAAVAFVLPLGPAPAAIAVGIGSTVAMLLVMGLCRLIYLKTVADGGQADLSGAP